MGDYIQLIRDVVNDKIERTSSEEQNEDKKIEIKFLLKNISYLYHSNEHELCYQEHSLVQQTF